MNNEKNMKTLGNIGRVFLITLCFMNDLGFIIKYLFYSHFSDSYTLQEDYFQTQLLSG